MMHQDGYVARGYSPEGQIYESQRPAQFGESRRSSGELRSVHDVGGASPIALTSSPTCHTCDEASHRNHMAGHPLGAMRVLSSRIGPESDGETAGGPRRRAEMGPDSVRTVCVTHGGRNESHLTAGGIPSGGCGRAR